MDKAFFTTSLEQNIQESFKKANAMEMENINGRTRKFTIKVNSLTAICTEEDVNIGKMVHIMTESGIIMNVMERAN